MAQVEIRGISKRFGATDVLQPTDLTVAAGEFVVVVGPSGCGKSTLLRLIAGLETPTTGRVAIDGRDVTDAAPADRGLAMVFQSYALYPHMTVEENIAFPMKVARAPAGETARRVAEIAATLDLTALLARKPAALSGGQRQRVSIARAIVRAPKLLLLDEPLSNLDSALRVRMRHEFARLHRQLGLTMIYVTHDQLEAMTLADRIVVMAAGRVEQVGAPLELYAHPHSLAVAIAIGSPGMNLVPATIVTVGAGETTVRLADGVDLTIPRSAPAGHRGAAATLGVRPEDLVPAEDGSFAGPVELVERLGAQSFAHVATAAGMMVAQLAGDARVAIGDVLRVGAAPAAFHLFGADGVAYRRAEETAEP